jgi:hypothetical protein
VVQLDLLVKVLQWAETHLWVETLQWEVIPLWEAILLWVVVCAQWDLLKAYLLVVELDHKVFLPVLVPSLETTVHKTP